MHQMAYDDKENPSAARSAASARMQLHRMIQGPGVRICDECVQLCMSILEDG